jgi:signal transduction histidine kinase/CheY-like chemotaxis protein
LNTIESSMRTEDLLQQSQTLTRELQSQQEELKTTNDRLEQQAINLQNSEALLKKQQEELQRANDELQEKARQLSDQMRQVEYKNREIEQAKAALEEKAEQLALSSRYKSEFLANMSHELRTPLNSLLILARMLADNPGSNLTPKQIEYAQTIHGAGTDLLSIINDILDLAKIESGTVTLNIEVDRFSELHDYVERTFRQVANGKGLDFEIKVGPGLPAAMQTDDKRLQQILKNLLSNAFKFTDQGGVTMQVSAAKSGWTPGHPQLDAAETVVAFSVTDTGVGIPASKQQSIFEPFQQADGTTSRRYGGTGLGLSISRELARLLGGEIRVVSAPAKGSTFTLYLPLTYRGAAAEKPADKLAVVAPAPQQLPQLSVPVPGPGEHGQRVFRTELSPTAQPTLRDDRNDIRPDDRVALVVEDDVRFATTLMDVMHEAGFKAVVALNGESAMALVKELLPDAITLDLRLPDMDGWALLDLLKHDPDTRHIPVNVISVTDHLHRCFHMGALGVVQKPVVKEVLEEVLARTRQFVERDVKTLLIANADGVLKAGIADALYDNGVKITEVDSGKKALELLQRDRFDCVLVGPQLRDMSAIELLRKFSRIKRAGEIPMVMYGAEDLSRGEQDNLRKLAEIVVVKTASTPEAVLEQTTLFLHQAVSNLPQKARRLLAQHAKASSELAGKRALIVDDDVRNIFALTSVLEQQGMVVYNAENGKDGIEVLSNTPDIDAVLMDIMMPELDGYDTIRIMRKVDAYKNLPIIAITAKAMKGDREKCMEAGASDYLAKPVNTEQLLSLLRVWTRQ